LPKQALTAAPNWDWEKYGNLLLTKSERKIEVVE